MVISKIQRKQHRNYTCEFYLISDRTLPSFLEKAIVYSSFPQKRSHSNFLLLCVGVACRRHIADLHLFLNAIAHPHLFPLGDNATHHCTRAGF
ncbi:hypothetical protein [Floridanema aerugineum]|uniref:Uncharacterized protein n=1 Tax=Floridaenema aerugineum BLCC-F46 TaxID=3153654 RepID=A0ABV4XGD2_9CYAN